MRLDKGKILDLVDEGYLIMNKHPEEDLFILNYSKTAQYEQYWNEYTLMCRGLIVDVDFNVVARPFPKFFNLEEHNKSEIPTDLPFEAYEKMDGSLGIAFYYNGAWRMATRGSFESEQAIKAGMMMNDNIDYMHGAVMLNTAFTYLFEIIYPENRIVVDYGDEEKLVMLAAIHTETGNELSWDEMVNAHGLHFEVVKKYDVSTDIRELKNLEEDNREGFVIKYSNGFRVKVKFSEYVRLHRILTNVSSKSIWEALRNGDGLDDIVDAVPDEFFNWVKETKRGFLEEFNRIERDALKEFHRIYIIERKTLKKDFAMIAKDHELSGLLFNLYDGRTDYSDKIWKMLKPKYEKPFADDKTDANVEGIVV
jgi:RNA ligase